MDANDTIYLPDGITQREIADLIGVSVSTVSRTLAGSARVSARTRSDVRDAIRRLREVATTEIARPPMVALIQSHAAEARSLERLDMILQHVMGGAEAAARSAGFMLYTVQDLRLLSVEGASPGFRDMRGLIMAGGLVATSLVDLVLQQGIPVVIAGGHLPERGIPSVASNSMEGVRNAVAYLIGLGHRRIGLVNGPSDTYTSSEKRAGYLTALAEADIPIDLELIRWHDGFEGFDVNEAVAMTGSLLDLPQRPTAIMFASDGMALAGMSACRARNLTIPEDVSVVGFHDDQDARMAFPPLTTVRVDRNEWGAAAFERLARLMDKPPSVADRLLLPTQLIVRDSTAPP